jgi:GTP cyclohydrolase IA
MTSTPLAPYTEALDSLAADGVRALIALSGDDPDREGVLETPARVIKAFKEMTAGYALDPVTILSKTFDVDHSGEIVLVRNVRFTSMCEHHLLTFSGEATVGYLPGNRVVGLSKLARLVDCFAKRFQVQERMTLQIAHAIEDVLGAVGVGVIVRASHSCMGCRGVSKPDADMVTSAMLGTFLSNQAQRAEFLTLSQL